MNHPVSHVSRFLKAAKTLESLANQLSQVRKVSGLVKCHHCNHMVALSDTGSECPNCGGDLQEKQKDAAVKVTAGYESLYGINPQVWEVFRKVTETPSFTIKWGKTDETGIKFNLKSKVTGDSAMGLDLAIYGANPMESTFTILNDFPRGRLDVPQIEFEVPFLPQEVSNLGVVHAALLDAGTRQELYWDGRLSDIKKLVSQNWITKFVERGQAYAKFNGPKVEAAFFKKQGLAQHSFIDALENFGSNDRVVDDSGDTDSDFWVPQNAAVKVTARQRITSSIEENLKLSEQIKRINLERMRKSEPGSKEYEHASQEVDKARKDIEYYERALK